MKQIKLVLFLFLAVALFSCSSVLRNPQVLALTTDYCKPQSDYFSSKEEYQDRVSNLQDSLLVGKMQKSDYLFAKNIGILSLLSDFVLTKDTLAKMAYRQKISDRIFLVNTELNAVSAELDCNGERYSQLSNYLNDINNKNLRKVTIASISTGALVAIASSLIGNKNTDIAVNISGGVASAGLGFLTLNPKGRKVEVSFSRSLVANIWNNQNTDNAFPMPIWKIMNEKAFSNSGEVSLAESIKKRWLQYSFDGSISEKTTNQFFKKGGLFSAEDLQKIESMNNQLQASIRSLQQNMLSLLISIDKVK
ncbi:hypothetical protein [Mucilaginibacter polytrichastri]|uniref:Lipoprotein n=1 Tax=Mucilaginibacter polytrichastri TaxID=1302689 RepID=A0A1Q5ZZ47_9SPHI|nr:hypothetical protein [Mucilaginibacter polytrichastri]OKS87018.1 hypothetical protein RG47T_2476 [Mucilaginibacter polytrichastri]SFS86001.1 hypothetical protein SAMN04487890_10584 [Mucilaginibacter polytrichastri]